MLLALGLATVGLPALAAAAGDAPGPATTSRLSALVAAIEHHRSATGEIPRDAKQLAVVARLYTPGTPIPRGVVVDGWGRPLVYQRTPDREPGYRLYSAGANGSDEAGDGDDVKLRPRAEPTGAGQDVERAIQLLPVLSLVVVAPIGWAFIRSARRGLG